VAVDEGFSEAIEDFLKAVYMLQQEQDRVQTSTLAETLKITAPSTTEMAKKLAKARLIEHEPYHGMRLTPAGERIALEIIRHHRLVELFLVRALDYTWDEVHEEAERLEHAISERLAHRMAEFLGNPRYDPHGDPIPSPEGDVYPRDLTPLAEWPLEQPGLVASVRDQSPDMLRYLSQKGLVVGVQVQVIARDPFDGPVALRVGECDQMIGQHVAQFILIQKL
jgi:DtxR family Mn-dependent transcriptional regulator